VQKKGKPLIRQNGNWVEKKTTERALGGHKKRNKKGRDLAVALTKKPGLTKKKRKKKKGVLP